MFHPVHIMSQICTVYVVVDVKVRAFLFPPEGSGSHCTRESLPVLHINQVLLYMYSFPFSNHFNRLFNSTGPSSLILVRE